MKIDLACKMVATCLCLAAAGAAAQENIERNCSVAVMRSDPQLALDACTALDNKADATARARAQVLKTRGRAFYALGRLDEALADFQAAAALDPKDPDIAVRSGWIALDHEQYDQTAAFVEKALGIDPNFGRAYDLAGAMLHRRGQLDKAIAAYEIAIQVSPDDPQPHFDRLKALIASGRRGDALREADVVLALPGPALSEPKTVSYDGIVLTSFKTAITLERAALLADMGRAAEASLAYRRAVDEDPCALTFTWRATDNLVHNAAAEVVVADIEKALSLDPDYWYAHIVRGRLDLRAGRNEAARAAFRAAATLAPTIGNARWWNARALRALGRIDEATEEALAAVEVDRDFIFSKAATLRALGYLAEMPANPQQSPAVQDAVRACMLDERCR